MMHGLFEFEQDGHYALRRIPMAIRLKLDLSGIRLPLAGWTLLSRDQRELLLELRCATEEERYAYRQTIVAMLKEHGEDPEMAAECFDVEQTPVWQNVSVIPSQVIDRLAALSIPVPTVNQWQSLEDLQRFALIKLTRSGHKNGNLLPALKEFGWA